MVFLFGSPTRLSNLFCICNSAQDMLRANYSLCVLKRIKKREKTHPRIKRNKSKLYSKGQLLDEYFFIIIFYQSSLRVPLIISLFIVKFLEYSNHCICLL